VIIINTIKDTGVITTYSLYITLALLSLLFLVFAPSLIDTNIFNWAGSEIRLFIIYFSTLLLVLLPSKN
jgi:NADH-ubiquinone oxidoreductase chain 5